MDRMRCPPFVAWCLSTALSSFPAVAAEPLSSISEGVVFVPGIYVPGGQPDGNSVIFETPEGLVLVDTGRHPRHAQAILAHIDERAKPLMAIVNTHWHLDHVSGNPAIREVWPDAEVHASLAIDAALNGFLARYRAQLVEAIANGADPAQSSQWRDEIARIDHGARLLPSVPVIAADTRIIGGRAFRIGLADAATRGDVWLYDPISRVLVAGDLITLPAPFFDTACPQRWRSAFAELAAIDFAVLVPGHGAPMNREGFNTYRRAFNNLLVCAETPASIETCTANWRSDAAALISETDRESVDVMIAYYVEHRLRGPAATRDCAG